LKSTAMELRGEALLDLAKEWRRRAWHSKGSNGMATLGKAMERRLNGLARRHAAQRLSGDVLKVKSSKGTDTLGKAT
jgi:hypothetical protein